MTWANNRVSCQPLLNGVAGGYQELPVSLAIHAWWVIFFINTYCEYLLNDRQNKLSAFSFAGAENWQTQASMRSIIKLLLVTSVCIFRFKLCSSVVFLHSPQEAFQATFSEQVIWAGAPMCTQQELFCSLHFGCLMQFFAQQKH